MINPNVLEKIYDKKGTPIEIDSLGNRKERRFGYGKGKYYETPIGTLVINKKFDGWEVFWVPKDQKAYFIKIKYNEILQQIMDCDLKPENIIHQVRRETEYGRYDECFTEEKQIEIAKQILALIELIGLVEIDSQKINWAVGLTNCSADVRSQAKKMIAKSSSFITRLLKKLVG